MSLYLRMKKLSYVLSYIKQDVYTFLFYFLRLSCGHSSFSLRHLPLGLSTSSLTLRQRVQLFLSRRCPFFRALRPGILINLFCFILFGTQHQLTHYPVKSLTLPLRKMPFFRALDFGILISLFTVPSFFETQHHLIHPPVKGSILSLRKTLIFQVAESCGTNFTLSCVIFLLRLSTSSLTLR